MKKKAFLKPFAVTIGTVVAVANASANASAPIAGDMTLDHAGSNAPPMAHGSHASHASHASHSSHASSSF